MRTTKAHPIIAIRAVNKILVRPMRLDDRLQQRQPIADLADLPHLLDVVDDHNVGVRIFQHMAHGVRRVCGVDARNDATVPECFEN